MVFKNFSNGLNIGFCSSQKRPHYIGFWKTSKMISTLAFSHYETPFHLVFENFETTSALAFVQKQFKFIGFQNLRKRSQHCLSFIAKATQIHWFSKTLETILTLAFAHCESNINSLVYENFRNDPNIGFHLLRKQLNYIDFTSYLWFIHITFIRSIHNYNQKFKFNLISCKQDFTCLFLRSSELHQ
jgi:hypothetical protein